MSGINVTPETAVGIPITRPENVADPPKWAAYALEDDTMMKKEIYSRNLVRSMGHAFADTHLHQDIRANNDNKGRIDVQLELVIMDQAFV